LFDRHIAGMIRAVRIGSPFYIWLHNLGQEDSHLSKRFEYRADFGWINDLQDEDTLEPVNYQDELVWNAGVEYLFSRNFSLMASYDNRFGVGGGLSVRF